MGRRPNKNLGDTSPPSFLLLSAAPTPTACWASFQNDSNVTIYPNKRKPALCGFTCQWWAHLPRCGQSPMALASGGANTFLRTSIDVQSTAASQLQLFLRKAPSSPIYYLEGTEARKRGLVGDVHIIMVGRHPPLNLEAVATERTGGE